MPAVVSPGTVGDAVVPQEPHPRSSAPQTDATRPRLEVRRAALAVRAALWRGRRKKGKVSVEAATPNQAWAIRGPPDLDG